MRQKNIIDPDKLRALWEAGLSVGQIAERLGRSYSTTAGALSRAKITSHKNHRVGYASASPGGSGRCGFAGAMARKS